MVKVRIWMVAAFFTALSTPISSPAQLTSSTEPHWLKPVGELVSRADSIFVGRIASMEEKMEKLSLDGVVSPFLTHTTTFQEVEVLKGDTKRRSVRQYSSFSKFEHFKKGDKIIVFLDKPTELNYDPIIGLSTLRLDNSRHVARDPDFLYLQNGPPFYGVGIHVIRDIIKIQSTK